MQEKKNDKWFLGTLNNSLAKDVVIPIDFLDPNKNYEVTIYRDKAPATIEKIVSNLEDLKENGTIASDELSISLENNGGEVAIFTELGEATAGNMPKKYDQFLSLYPNPANKHIYLQSHSLADQKVHLKIYSLKGEKIISTNLTLKPNGTEINISDVPKGTYILVIENENIKTSRTFVINH